MEKRIVPCYDVDCVIDFFDLARAMELDPEELFYKLFPYNDYDETESGKCMRINCYNKLIYSEEDETREAWEEVRFIIEDCGYRFYDYVMMVF